MQPTQSRSGTVIFFDDQKGWGFVRLANGESAFVHRSVLPVTGYRTLFPDEPVRVREQGNRGLQVVELQIPLERLHGKVREFDLRRGFGVIETDDGKTYFAHYTNLLTRGRGPRAELGVGEAVEFFTRPREGRGLEAFRIKRLDARQPLERFTCVPDQGWQDLAALAEMEDWDYRSPDPDGQEFETETEEAGSESRLPILKSYIRYTFARLEVEGKIVQGVRNGSTFAGFNTGLVTANQEEIYGLVEEHDERVDGHEWRLVAWVKASDNRVSSLFAPRPPLATYWTDPSVLFFRPGREIVLDYDHFIDDNLDRYPPMFASNPELARMATVAAVDAAKRRVARNYKTAVPQYYRGEIQLLLPLSLDGSGRAQLALVVRDAGNEYIGETVLPLHASLNNARLLAKPDRDWLNP